MGQVALSIAVVWGKELPSTVVDPGKLKNSYRHLISKDAHFKRQLETQTG